jgi:translation initiation factor IF-3
VKVVVMFRGREVVHRDIGFRIIEDVIARVADQCIVEKSAGIEGRDMHAVISPKPVEAVKKPKAPKPEAPVQNTPS